MIAENSYSEYVKNLNEIELYEIIDDAKDWAICNGLAIRTNECKNTSDVCQIAPFALFPSIFPKDLYNYGLNIQELMSELYFRVSYDINFLLNALQSVCISDEFTRNLVNIMKTIYLEGNYQQKSLLVQRSDYMCHIDESGKFFLKQIEVNNIAASMGGLSERVSMLHKRLIKKAKLDAKCCPNNKPIDTISNGLYSAWKEYGNLKALILIVVEEKTQNITDQRFIEHKLEQNFENSVSCIRLTLSQCFLRLSLSNSKELIIDNNKYVISVVYFRAGYDPSNYPTNNEWEARLLIERSMAIKCPWIGLQLANTKKIQQELAEDGVLEKYLDDKKSAAKMIRNTFAGLWGLDKPNVKNSAIFEKALSNPNIYVLKPQLEGGARNYYGAEITEKLKQFDKHELAAHILMEKVSPLIVRNYLVRAFSKPTLSNVVGELGFFGTYLGNGETLEKISGFNGGHVLRTKFEDVNEGGVTVGAAVIDSPFLV